MGFVSQRFIPGARLIDGTDLNNFVDQVNSGPSSGPTYYVNETLGSDNQNNDGTNPYAPLKTLDRALVLESAALAGLGLSSVGRNAVVAFWGTQHRTSTLAWNLPATHLVGLGGSQRRGKRARISVTGTTAYDKLVSVTAQGCEFANFGTFYGFNSASASICWSDTAGRSTYDNVEFMGFGDGTASTGTANHTAARAFVMNTSNGESSWYNCVFGVDTVVRDATNYTLELAGGAPRLYFENCTFEADLGSSGTSACHVLIGVGGIDRYVEFQDCKFSNFGANAMGQAFNVDASAGGNVLLTGQNTTVFGNITAIQTTPTANMLMTMVKATTGGGIAHEVF